MGSILRSKAWISSRARSWTREYFGAELAAAAAKDPAYRERLRDMNRRVLYAIYAAGLDTHPVTKGGAIDFSAHRALAEEVAREGIALLRNSRDVLPLTAALRRIAVIGGFADAGVLSGGGSSQVHMEGGPAAAVPQGSAGSDAAQVTEQYQRSTPPLAAIRALAPGAVVTYRNGFYLADAIEQANRAEVAIVFANQWQAEGRDLPDLSLPRGQDALIEAVAAANPNTIVVLQSGSAVLMPWLERTAAVVAAWYPGARGGEAIAAVLFGASNPSGRLPMTCPASLAQLPRPKLDGSDSVEPAFVSKPRPGQTLDVNYDIDGADLGYRWNARKGYRAQFPFGFGLSYTRFATTQFSMSGLKARVTVRNTGARAGATVVQLYLISAAGRRMQRLAGIEKLTLNPGESRSVEIAADPRIFATWTGKAWQIDAGNYAFAIGEDAERLGAALSVTLAGRRWGP